MDGAARAVVTRVFDSPPSPPTCAVAAAVVGAGAGLVVSLFVAVAVVVVVVVVVVCADSILWTGAPAFMCDVNMPD